MKKLLFLAAMLIGAASYGQTNNFTYSGATHDTLTNSNTVYAYFGSAGVIGSVSALGADFHPVKITGTTVGGYAILQSCDDGVNYSNHFGNVGTTGYSVDTATIANTASTQNLKWHIGDATMKYYRLKIVGNQTQTVKLAGKYSCRSN